MLIMGSVNVASLFIARALERQKEFGTRHALGAPQGRLIFQALVESVTHGLIAGLAGIAFAHLLVQSLRSMLPERLGYVPEFGLNLTVVAFALGAALFTSVLFGIVPAFHTASGSLTEVLKEGGRSGSMGVRGRHWQSAMVCAELALTFMLLVGAGLAVRTFMHLSNVDMGFDPNNLLTAKVALPEASYRDPIRRNQFVNSIVERLRSVPGVTAAAAVNTAPFTGPLSSIGISVEGKELPVGKTAAEPDVLVATPQFFSTLKTKIVKGRLFDETDHRNSTPVAVVDDTLAASLWGNASPLKQRIKFGPLGSDNTWIEVIGVIRHVKHDYEEGGIRPQIYQPYSQAPTSVIVFVARAGANTALIPTLRRAIYEVDPTRPVYDIREMTSLMGDEGARYRLNVTVMSAFGGLSLILACVGLYGVLAYSVRTRQQEIGIRVALGASQSQIRSLVLRDGLRLTLIGLAVGLLLALALGRLMATALVGVVPLDTPTYVFTLTALAGVALVATLLPAMRASSVDPSTVLRNG
jgi:putative ABC transport system permease protein